MDLRRPHMDEFAPAHGAALSRPRPVSCPPWCTDNPHDDLDPPGTALHRSPPATVTATTRRVSWSPRTSGPPFGTRHRSGSAPTRPTWNAPTSRSASPTAAQACPCISRRDRPAASPPPSCAPLTPPTPKPSTARRYPPSCPRPPRLSVRPYRRLDASAPVGMDGSRVPDRRAPAMIIRRKRHGIIHAHRPHDRGR